VSPHPEQSRDSRAPQLTELLRQMQQGDRDAGEMAVGLVYGELHRIASRQLRRESPGHTLVTGALINEAYLHFSAGNSFAIESRGHFLAIASQQMRRILVDHARAKNAQRRGGDAVHVSLDQAHAGSASVSVDVLMLDIALVNFERDYPRAAKVVELRYFGGYSDKQAAEALGVSLNTVRRDWEFARCWLFDRMSGKRESADSGS
jgi:RNA polymerase sigma-70 factor, ECF subfamily